MKKYDDKGNLIYSSGKGWKVWYDTNGNIIHEKWSDGDEHWCDDNGNIVRKI